MSPEPSLPTDPIEKLRVLYGFMSRQLFVAGRPQLLRLGFSSTTIASWSRTGRLVPVLRGVYSYGRDVDTRLAAWKAAEIFGGKESAITGSSACELWGITQEAAPLPRRIIVARESTRSKVRNGLSPVLRSTEFNFVCRRLDRGDTTIEHGIRVVKPALALIELAASATRRDLVFAFLEACRLGYLDHAEIESCFRRAVGRRGASKLNPILASWLPELSRIRSVLEGMFLLAWAGNGRPMPLVNARVAGFEVDMYWPEFDLVLELDGTAFHTDRMAKARDQAKARKLEESGVSVLRAGFADVDSHPGRVVQAIENEMTAIRRRR